MFQSQVHCSVIVLFNKDCSGTGMHDGKARTRGAGGNAMKVQVVYGQWSKSQSVVLLVVRGVVWKIRIVLKTLN